MANLSTILKFINNQQLSFCIRGPRACQRCYLMWFIMRICFTSASRVLIGKAPSTQKRMRKASCATRSHTLWARRSCHQGRKTISVTFMWLNLNEPHWIFPITAGFFKRTFGTETSKYPSVSVSVTWSRVTNRGEADAVESVLFVRYFSNFILNSES